MPRDAAVAIVLRRKFQFRLRTLFLSVTALAISIVLAGWLTGGWATGVEWSPDKFCHRSFRYFVMFGEIFPDGVKSAPIQTREWESHLEAWLKQQGYVEIGPGEPRWYLSKGFAPGVRGWSGPAKRICQQLRCWGNRDSDEWIDWSKAHPDTAADLWPAVVKLAREKDGRGTDTAADLLDIARSSTSHENYFRESRRRLELHSQGRDP